MFLDMRCLACFNTWRVLKGKQVSGKVVQIFIASHEGAPMQEVTHARAIAHMGLEQDRYAGERGAWSKSRRSVIRHISLIEEEAIEEVNKKLQNPFLASETRRNIVVKNFSLNDKLGKEFMVGLVAMRGVELCDPCERPSTLSGKSGFKEAFAGHGGLRAEVLNSGLIFAGTSISTETFFCLLCGFLTSCPHVCPELHPELLEKTSPI